jgi:hypothetical protein
MPIITGGKIIEGLMRGYMSSGAPTAGVNEIQTITIGGTPSGGTFILSFDGFLTTAITWVAVNATLLASIDAALEALPNIGTGGVTTAAGTLTAGIGTLTVTFTGNNAASAVSTIVVANNSMTGSSPTIVCAETTPGVTPSGKGAAIGGTLTDITNGKIYINTGTALAPVWTVVGAQT